MLVRYLIAAILGLSPCIFGQTRTAEKIECQALPARVLAAAGKEKARPGGERACEKIMEKGATLYELKVTDESGKMREIVYRPDGKIVEFEEESDLSQIPAAARAAIQKETALGELLKVDVIHRGATTLYEGEYRLTGVKKKIVVDGRGRTMSN